MCPDVVKEITDSFITKVWIGIILLVMDSVHKTEPSYLSSNGLSQNNQHIYSLSSTVIWDIIDIGLDQIIFH